LDLDKTFYTQDENEKGHTPSNKRLSTNKFLPELKEENPYIE
jgi:hypothetical protein